MRDKEEATRKRLALPPLKQLEIAERNLAHKEKTAKEADKEVERLQELLEEATKKVQLAQERTKERHAELAVRIQELDDAKKRVTIAPAIPDVPEELATLFKVMETTTPSAASIRAQEEIFKSIELFMEKFKAPQKEEESEKDDDMVPMDMSHLKSLVPDDVSDENLLDDDEIQKIRDDAGAKGGLLREQKKRIQEGIREAQQDKRRNSDK